jgi:hypothetical protein
VCVIAAEVKELEEKGELDDADPLGAFFKKIFSQVGGACCCCRCCRVVHHAVQASGQVLLLSTL